MSYTSLIPSVTISVQNLYDLLDTYFESPVLEKVKDEKEPQNVETPEKTK